MIYKNSQLKSADNSGAKKIKCISIFRKSTGSLGDIIYVIIQKINIRKKLLKKKLYKALLIGTKCRKKRLNHHFIKFKNNRVLLLDEKFKFLGTRVYGPISKEVRYCLKSSRYKKIISYSQGTV